MSSHPVQAPDCPAEAAVNMLTARAHLAATEVHASDFPSPMRDSNLASRLLLQAALRCQRNPHLTAVINALGELQREYQLPSADHMDWAKCHENLHLALQEWADAEYVESQKCEEAYFAEDVA